MRHRHKHHGAKSSLEVSQCLIETQGVNLCDQQAKRSNKVLGRLDNIWIVHFPQDCLNQGSLDKTFCSQLLKGGKQTKPEGVLYFCLA